MGQLWPRHRERQPPRVRRDGLARHRQEPGPAGLLAPLGQRLPAFQPPRRRPASGRQPRALPAEPAHRRRRAAPRLAGRPGRPQRGAGQGDRRPRDRHPREGLRDGLPHADLGTRADRYLPGIPRDPGGLRPRGHPSRLVRGQLPASPPPARTRRPVRPALPPRLGPAHRPLASATQPVPRHRPADGRPDQGPEGARHARGHAGGLRDRVRPHGVQPGWLRQPGRRARPPRPFLHRLARRRRREGRLRARRHG